MSFHSSARRPSSSPFAAPPVPEVPSFAVGDRVVHDGHGMGAVVATDPSGVMVDFGNGRVRVPSPFARMDKL